MKTVPSSRLSRLEKQGAKIVRPVEPDPVPDPMPGALEAVAKVTMQAAQTMETLQKKLLEMESPEREPKPYKFVIQRDKNRLIQSVIAVPGE